MKKIMQGHIEDMAEDKVVLGDTLESALEQGEKHELFATKCMEVREGGREGGKGKGEGREGGREGEKEGGKGNLPTLLVPYPYLPQTMDEQMNKLRTDASNLCSPTFGPTELEATAHSATQKAVEAVRSQLKELTKTYEQLVTTCQQKRDLYIICVKFHMKMRQVCCTFV